MFRLTRVARISIVGFVAAGLALAAWGVSASLAPSNAAPAAIMPVPDTASSLLAPDLVPTASLSGQRPDAGAGDPDAGKPAPALTEAGFLNDCIKPLRAEHYSQAVAACLRYSNDQNLGAGAHAALAAIYSTRAYRDVAASVTHAERAAEMGDPRGKFMMAIQMLAGYSTRPFDMALVRKLLNDARSSGVPQAGMMLDRVAQSEQCRADKQAFKLLDAPIFCLFRPEVSQVLAARGMTQRSADPTQWSDVWRPGDVLPVANQAELLFDRDPDDEMLRLAQFTYRIDAITASDQLPLVEQALRQKYGAPARGRGDPAAGTTTVWHTPSGIDITLARLADGSVELRYAQPQRALERGTHLAREEELSRQARIRRQQIAL